MLSETPVVTPSQFKVLSYTVKGLSNKEIAKELGVGRRTVDSHVQALFRAFDTKTRTELVYKLVYQDTEFFVARTDRYKNYRYFIPPPCYF